MMKFGPLFLIFSMAVYAKTFKIATQAPLETTWANHLQGMADEVDKKNSGAGQV